MGTRKPPSAPPTAWAVAIPGFLPTPLNVLMRMHWAARNRRLKAEYATVQLHCRKAGVPKAAGKRRVSQRLTLAGRDKPRDPDGMNKGVLDALTKGGFLVDDSAEFVEIGPPEFVRGEKRMTTIVIEDV